MYIQDISNFPVIPVGYNNQDGLCVEQNIQCFESLLLKEQPFVFLSEGPFPEEQASHEERKFVAAWVKKIVSVYSAMYKPSSILKQSNNNV